MMYAVVITAKPKCPMVILGVDQNATDAIERLRKYRHPFSRGEKDKAFGPSPSGRGWREAPGEERANSRHFRFELAPTVIQPVDFRLSLLQLRVALLECFGIRCDRRILSATARIGETFLGRE
jgi:hypothetical protein